MYGFQPLHQPEFPSVALTSLLHTFSHLTSLSSFNLQIDVWKVKCFHILVYIYLAIIPFFWTSKVGW